MTYVVKTWEDYESFVQAGQRNLRRIRENNACKTCGERWIDIKVLPGKVIFTCEKTHAWEIELEAAP